MTSEENISESGLTLSGNDLIMSNRFTCIEEIYSSKKGYANIYRAQRMGKWHALKCLKHEYAGSTLHLGLLHKEFDICYRLSHPNIVHVLGMEEVEGLGLCIVMEYVEGCTLRRFMDEGRITKYTAKSIISQTCDALAYIHGLQIIHRDLKPENLIITTTGNYVKLIDFGYSDADSYTVLKMPAGTRRYAAPEQLGNGKVDARTDLFALGIIIGEINGKLRHGSYKLKRIACRCTRKEPERRYASAEEVKLQIGRYGYKSLVVACVLPMAFALTVYCYYPRTQHIEYIQSVPEPVSTPTAANKNITTKQEPAKEYTATHKDNTATKETVKEINADDRMAYLIKFARENTVKILDDTYRKLNDSTLSDEYRRKVAHSYYSDMEKVIKDEVDKVSVPGSPENAIYWNTIRTVVAETSKDYHLKNK